MWRPVKLPDYLKKGYRDGAKIETCPPFSVVGFYHIRATHGLGALVEVRSAGGRLSKGE